MTREEIAAMILNGMISSPPEGINRFKVDKLNWCKIAFEWADNFILARDAEQGKKK